MGIRLVAGALLTLCFAACATAGASAAGAEGGRTIAGAPSLKLNTPIRGRLHDGAFYSGYSAGFWTASLHKGDRLSVRTTAAKGATPPCQMLFMPGTDDVNVGATTPILDPVPESQTRDGSRAFQRWVTATETGTYVLAMTNADVYLTGPNQCLSAPAAQPFTFKVTVAHRGSGKRSAPTGGGEDRAGPEHGTRHATQVVAAGQSLWVIAQGLVREPGSIAQVAFKVQRLWQLNAGSIGTRNPNLIYPGQSLRVN